MVAETQRNGSGVDAEVLGVFDSLQGHVGQSIKQVFEVLRRRELRNAKLGLDAREYLITDQFTNLYVVFAADLIDGERHVVPSFIGSQTKGLCKKYAHFQTFSDSMLAHLQDEAFLIYGRAMVAIMQARQAANVPTLVRSHGEQSQ